jgi:hypothetical protein
MSGKTTGGPHGYGSDLDALRVIARLYAESALDALAVVYLASDDDRGRALDQWSALNQAAEELGRTWASGVAHGVRLRTTAEALEWRAIVTEDVRARLAGDMGRPLPELY